MIARNTRGNSEVNIIIALFLFTSTSSVRANHSLYTKSIIYSIVKAQAEKPESFQTDSLMNKHEQSNTA